MENFFRRWSDVLVIGMMGWGKSKTQVGWKETEYGTAPCYNFSRDGFLAWGCTRQEQLHRLVSGAEFAFSSSSSSCPLVRNRCGQIQSRSMSHYLVTL